MVSSPKIAFAIVLVLLKAFSQQAAAFSSQPPAELLQSKFRLAASTEDDDVSAYSPPATFDTYIAGKSSNVVYEDTVVGDGESIQWGKMATVEYTGRLLVGGKEFDRGTFAFKVGMGEVITGWDQGLLGMKIGGKRTLKIPPNLAYGKRGSGDNIPPDADLIFDCKLKGVGTTMGTTAAGPLADVAAKFRRFFK